MDDLKSEFLAETLFFIDLIEESFLNLRDPEKKDEQLANVFRLMHSIKGAGAAVGFNELSEFSHHMEDLLTILRVGRISVDHSIETLLLSGVDLLKDRITKLKAGEVGPWPIQEFQVKLKMKVAELQTPSSPKQEPRDEKFHLKPSTVTLSMNEPEAFKNANKAISPVAHEKNFIKVDIERVNFILDTISELVVIRSQLFNELGSMVDANSRLTPILELYDRSIRDLQEKAMGLRMTPLKSTFLKLQRVARDLSVKLDKPTEVHLSGEDVEIDRQVVEALSDPLLHLVRNCLDHGVEITEERKKMGKPLEARLNVLAKVVGGRIEIKIQDDGAGIQRLKVFEKAKKGGLLPPDTKIESLTDQQIYDFLFQAGFSTKEQVSEISGRGVGLDVVKTNISKLKGSVKVDSQPGRGTTFTISLPMMASVTDGILIRAGLHQMVLPLDSVYGLSDIRKVEIVRTQKQGSMIEWQNTMLPVYYLSDLLENEKYKAPPEAHKLMLILDGIEGYMAVLVEDVIGQSQVVSKSVRTADGTSQETVGTAILGDGRVALVLNPHDLWTSSLKKVTSTEAVA